MIDLIVGAVAVGAAGSAGWFASRRRGDRQTITGLRRALGGQCGQLPGIVVGSAVVSACSAAGVGGDIVDVFDLDSRFAMLLVADVSGKGLDAAAQTAFIKYSMRTLALASDGDPAVVVATFNAFYRRTVKDDEAFVVLILGIIDSQTGEVRYASAGHEPAFLRRLDGSVRMLAPTGPIIGASPYSAYRSDVVLLNPGDVLVWATDGMTESRDERRRLLGVDGLMAWIKAAPVDVAGIADSLRASLRRRCRGVSGDDAAVLAVAYDASASRSAPSSRVVLSR